jgi:ATP adenylyltransferase
MKDCPYCEELEKGTLELKGADYGNRILFESDNFIVFPTIGQLVEGYLLITSKQHHISIGALPAELYEELERVKSKVKEVLRTTYGNPLFFEHGPATRRKKGGCCIDHAHLHAVPVNLKLSDSLSDEFKGRRIRSFEKIKDKHIKGEPYFFVEENDGTMRIFDIPAVVPSQYIRKLIAMKLDEPDIWDWKEHPRMELLSNTINKIKHEF